MIRSVFFFLVASVFVTLAKAGTNAEGVCCTVLLVQFLLLDQRVSRSILDDDADDDDESMCCMTVLNDFNRSRYFCDPYSHPF